MDTSDCGCNPGYFDDGVNVDCQVCSYPCLNCTDTNTCEGICDTPENRNSSPECSCHDGYFDNGTFCECKIINKYYFSHFSLNRMRQYLMCYL